MTLVLVNICLPIGVVIYYFIKAIFGGDDDILSVSDAPPAKAPAKDAGGDGGVTKFACASHILHRRSQAPCATQLSALLRSPAERWCRLLTRCASLAETRSLGKTRWSDRLARAEQIKTVILYYQRPRRRQTHGLENVKYLAEAIQLIRRTDEWAAPL